MRTTRKGIPPDGTKMAIVLWRRGTPYLAVGIVKSALKGKRQIRESWVEFGGKELNILPGDLHQGPKTAIEEEIRAIIRANGIVSREEQLLAAIFGRPTTPPLEVARQLSALRRLWFSYKKRLAVALPALAAARKGEPLTEPMETCGDVQRSLPAEAATENRI